MDDRIISLSVNIVSAYVAANNVAAVQIPGLIREVRQALSTGGQPVEALAPEPAVAAAKSVFADHLVCLDCGGSFKTLKRHLSADHELTPDAYRTKWASALSGTDPGVLVKIDPLTFFLSVGSVSVNAGVVVID